VQVVFESEYVGDETGAVSNELVMLGRLASPEFCTFDITTSGLPEDILILGGGTLSNAFEAIGDRLQFAVEYNATVGQCEYWIDPIGTTPGTGSLHNETVAAAAANTLDSIRLDNARGDIQIFIRNFAWCAPGPCVFP